MVSAASPDQSRREVVFDEVEVPGPDGQLRRHPGWPPDTAQGVVGYPVPAVACPNPAHTGLQWLTVDGVEVVGGVHSLIWKMVCTLCMHRHEYPATDYTEAEA